MFVLNVKYTADLAEIDKHLLAHRDWLNEHCQKGVFLFAGAQIPRTGGIIIATLRNREEMEKLVKTDPFSINKVAEYTIIEFKAALSHPDLAQFTDK